jgi:hypothetical protein
MSPHQIIAVAVRLFAVWLAIYISRDVLWFFFEGSKQQDAYPFWISLFVAVASIVIVIVLWLFPRTIARHLLSSESAETATASPDLWLALGCALIGIWLLSSAIPGLVRNSFVLVLYRSADVDTSTLRTSFAFYIPQVLIAFWLIFGAKGLRKLFWWARSVGR